LIDEHIDIAGQYSWRKWQLLTSTRKYLANGNTATVTIFYQYEIAYR